MLILRKAMAATGQPYGSNHAPYRAIRVRSRPAIRHEPPRKDAGRAMTGQSGALEPDAALPAAPEPESMFRMLVENVADGILAVDGQGRIRYWNAAASRIFGYTREEILGRELTLLMPPETRDRHGHILELLRKGTPPPMPDSPRQVTGLRKDGGQAHLELSLAVWDQGPESLYAAIVRDITARKRMEAEIIQAKEQAEAASRSKSEFLANMSHEVRTPLNGIMGMLQLLQETAPSPEQGEYIETALLSGKSLLRVIDDILDFSKIEAGKMEIEHKPFRLREILDVLPALFGRQAERKGLRFELSQPEGDSAFMGDAGRIRQVLFNLVGNALKFTERGGISVRVEALAVNGPERVRLAFGVADTGIGMSPEQVARLFEPFTQADGSYTRKYQGTGLGLAIAKRLVTSMGGGISVESAPGRGTTFRFTVSVGAGPASASAPRETGPRQPRRLHILLAEDERINQSLIKRLLETEGHSVRCVEDGMHALAALAEEPFDCVFMDVEMPVLDGIEAVRRIRSRAPGVPNPRIPVIALTAHSLDGNRERFLRAGMSDYLPKPVNRESLRAALARNVR